MKRLTLILAALAALLSSCGNVVEPRQPAGILITADGRVAVSGVVDFGLDSTGVINRDIPFSDCKIAVIDASNTLQNKTIATFSYTNSVAQLDLGRWPINPSVDVAKLFASVPDAVITNKNAKIISVSLRAYNSKGNLLANFIISNRTVKKPTITRQAAIIYSSEQTTITGTATTGSNVTELMVELRKGWNTLVKATETTPSVTKTMIWANNFALSDMRWTTDRK